MTTRKEKLIKIAIWYQDSTELLPPGLTRTYYDDRLYDEVVQLFEGECEGHLWGHCEKCSSKITYATPEDYVIHPHGLDEDHSWLGND